MEQMRKGGREVTEGSRVTHRWVQWRMTLFTEKVRVRKHRPRGRGGQWKGRTVGSHVVWSQPSFSQGSWPLSVRVLCKTRMDTNSSTQSSSLVARHRCSYDTSTHLDLYRVVLVEVDWCDSRDIEAVCFTCETEKQQEPWPPNLLGRERSELSCRVD